MGYELSGSRFKHLKRKWTDITMKYQTGSTGRIFVVRFEDGDDLLEGLARIARTEEIRSATFHLLGGIREGRYVAGPARDEFPPEPVWQSLTEPNEFLGFGTIFWQDDEPKVHFHAAFGHGNETRVGCLRENSGAFLVVEAVITEILGLNARRVLDPKSKMILLEL